MHIQVQPQWKDPNLILTTIEVKLSTAVNAGFTSHHMFEESWKS